MHMGGTWGTPKAAPGGAAAAILASAALPPAAAAAAAAAAAPGGMTRGWGAAPKASTDVLVLGKLDAAMVVEAEEMGRLAGALAAASGDDTVSDEAVAALETELAGATARHAAIAEQRTALRAYQGAATGTQLTVETIQARAALTASTERVVRKAGLTPEALEAAKTREEDVRELGSALIAAATARPAAPVASAAVKAVAAAQVAERRRARVAATADGALRGRPAGAAAAAAAAAEGATRRGDAVLPPPPAVRDAMFEAWN